jgi:hypothetical protein
VAAWLKKGAAVAFPAKPEPLPPGPYTQTCSGCRVRSARGANVLRCNSCDGSSPSARHEVPLGVGAPCAEYANVGGVLQCGAEELALDDAEDTEPPAADAGKEL